MGGFWGLVTKPQSNHGAVETRSQHFHCRGVSKLVESHTFFPQGGTGLAGRLNLFRQNVTHTICAKMTTTRIGKYDVAICFGSVLQPVFEDRTSLLGEGYTSGLSTFAHHPNMGTRAQ